MSNVQKKIVKYFIKSSSVGEVGMVLKDLCSIIDREILNNEDIQNALKEYFELHKQHIKLPDGRIAMVTEIGRQNVIEETEDGEPANPFVYFDAKLGIKFSFDPNTMQATVLGSESDFPEELDDQWATYKAGIEAAVDTYIAQNYKQGTTRACLCFNQNGNLQIDISCINTNFKAFWGGEWQASWEVDTQASSLSGVIKINNHYFESGNVHFAIEQQFQGIELAQADAENIVTAINRTETAHQQKIEEMHEGIEDVFKRMRRKLPVTGTKMNWANPGAMTM